MALKTNANGPNAISNTAASAIRLPSCQRTIRWTSARPMANATKLIKIPVRIREPPGGVSTRMSSGYSGNRTVEWAVV